MRVAVIGATGQLGGEIVRALERGRNDAVAALGHEDVECADPRSVEKALAAFHPDVVVNCAAFVRVDECEDRPDEAFRVNALGALHVARAVAQAGALCVHVSTDYVFGGDKIEPYTEEDCPSPVNIYGASKLAGEYLVRQACHDWLVVRVSSLFGPRGARGKGGNFVSAVLERARAGETLRVVNDVRISPTYALDAAWALERLVRMGMRGIFHLTNRGWCTWYDFARRAVELAELRVPVEPVASADYPTRARRPANSSLSTEKLVRMAGIHMRPWEEALEAYLRQHGLLTLHSNTGG